MSATSACNEAIESLLDRIRDPVQTRRAFADPKPSPFSAQCTPSRVYGLIYLRFVCFGDLRDHRAVRRIHVGKLVLSGHEAAIDVILD